MGIKKYDVVIIGGGTGGVCSAAALCNSGYKVALIESNSSLGGTTTEGFVSTWIEGANLDFHVQMFQNLCESGDLTGDVEKSWLPTKFANGKESCIIKLNPYKVAEYYRNYFDAANNIDVYYGYSFKNVTKMNGNTISEILVANEGTTYIFTARFFIDASGDGVLCRAASRYISSSEELYFLGRDEKKRFNESLAMDHNDSTQLNEPSLFFELTDANCDYALYQNITSVYAVYSTSKGQEQISDEIFLNNSLFDDKNYDLSKISIVKPPYIVIDGYKDTFLFKEGRMFLCNPMTGAGVTGHNFMRYSKEEQYDILKEKTMEYWKYIKYSLMLAKRKGEHGVWNNSGWTVEEGKFTVGDRFATMCGIRESYRIKCRYMLNQNDLVKDVRECEDLKKERYIAIGSHNVDMHNQWGLSGIQEFNKNSLRPYGIKYDSLIPSFLANVLVCCKAFGASQIAISSARTVKTISQIGWAGGCAIKLCLDSNLIDTTMDDDLIEKLQSDKYTNFANYHLAIKNI